MFFSRRGRTASHRLITFTLSMNLMLALVLEISIYSANAASKSSNNDNTYEDNEFAEFEEFDEEEEVARKVPSEPNKFRPEEPASAPGKPDVFVDDDADSVVEDEDEDDIFENVKEPLDSRETEDRIKPSGKKGDLKFTSVPLHLRSNWESYYLEILMAAGIIVYFVNFMTGRSKNHKLATAWLESNRDLLESNFALVGDDLKKEVEDPGQLLKETENVYTLWCSGRVAVEGMLVELKLIKRQDLVSTIARLVKPAVDQIIIKVNLNEDAMDNFVFCVAAKKTGVKLAKEMNDIATFCPDKKGAEKYGINTEKFVLMNEIGEAAGVILDSKVISMFNKYEDIIDYIHLSDQFSGPRTAEESQMIKLPDVKKIMIFAFNCAPPKGQTTVESIENLKPLTQLVFYMIDKVKRFKLSKEGKNKSEKNRQRVEEIFLKATHAQRQEQAQVKREERRRAEKEKILNEQDPEKQRRWEEKEHKRDMKRKTPKMKQLKVKAM